MKSKILFVCLLALVLAVSGCSNKGNEDGTGAEEPNTENVTYENMDYGFTFQLPMEWKDYSIITEQWEGMGLTGEKSGQVTESGPIVTIRHPQWTEDVPRQDIPIMVFTLDQWEELQTEMFSVGAAPMPPSELGRNSAYVFAIPARYNFAFPEGYEEVEDILSNHPLETFDPDTAS